MILRGLSRKELKMISRQYAGNGGRMTKHKEKDLQTQKQTNTQIMQSSLWSFITGK
jgi:hypothetical protein